MACDCFGAVAREPNDKKTSAAGSRIATVGFEPFNSAQLLVECSPLRRLLLASFSRRTRKMGYAIDKSRRPT